MKTLETTHTPGPWTLTENNTVCDEYRVRIATIEQFNHFSENEGNARLISASPDLLDALEKAVHCLAFHVERLGNGVAMDAEYLRQARAAIAKAKGA